MTSPKHYVRQFLLGYPTLYRSPKEVLIAAFTDRYSYDSLWDKDGNLTHPEIPTATSMDYSDLDERVKENEDRVNSPVLRDLGTTFTLRIMKERMDRKFIEDNLEDILECALNEDFSISRVRRHRRYTIDLYNTKEYPAFTFPDNINKEWASLLYTFLGNWFPDLAGVYGYAPYEKDSEWQQWIAHWPEDVKALYAQIMDARERLHPHVYNGQTYDEYKNRMEKLLNSFNEKA
jgi:hypothetical protein